MLMGSLSPAPQETKFQGADKVPRGVQNSVKTRPWLGFLKYPSDQDKWLVRQPKPRIKRECLFFLIGRIAMPVGDEHSRRPPTVEGEAAGAGLAALALLSRLLRLLVETRNVSAGELREAVDEALLSL